MSGGGGFEIDPSGRPLNRAGFEAAYALGLIVVWTVLMGGIFAAMGDDLGAAGVWPSLTLAAVCCFCWAYAHNLARVRLLIWPASALGILGPLSLGFALALATPELRTGPMQDRFAVITSVAGAGMVPFMFRFKLPGLVSPIMTFGLVGLFIALYGADADRMRQMEGFSPRGIVAALLDDPLLGALFGVLALGGVALARHLDLRGDNFGLASARPLHLVGGGVAALIAGRLLGHLPAGLDLAALALAWVGATVWTLRINRFAVGVAMHFAMAKPVLWAITGLTGWQFSLWDIALVLNAILAADIVLWPVLHKLSRDLGWTCGPGGRLPPDRRGWFWRYWPYATDEQLDRWAAERAERRARRAARRASRRGRRGLSGGDDTAATEPQ